MTLIQHVKSGGKFEEIYRYSRLIRIGDWIMSSGTAGRNYATREISSDVTGQVHQAIANLTRALEPLDASVKDIVHIRVFISSQDHLNEALEALATYFEGFDPVHAIHCGPLPGGEEVKIELEITCFKPTSSEIKREWIVAAPK
jgi:enamine deaminase RidA (YjgF/YER057c/UK114 family)